MRIGLGPAPHQKPVICIELAAGDSDKNKDELTRELLALGQKYDHTRAIDTILFHDAFPVDIRHNSKIFREKLAKWAEKKLGS